MLAVDEGRVIAVAVFWYGKINSYLYVLKVRGVIS